MKDSLHRFKEHDWNTGAWFAETGPGVVAEIERNLTALDTEARQLAALFLIEKNGLEAARLLLAMTGDDDEQIAGLAAQGLVSVAEPPPAAAILKIIPERRSALVRSCLYKALGRTGDKEALKSVRSLRRHETDEEALIEGLAAAILLGGELERDELLERIERARPSQAFLFQEILLRIGDARLAQGLLPWMSNFAPVTRLGSDADGRMLRMCDVAVWTAHLMGIRFPLSSERPSNFDAQTLAAGQAALAEIGRDR